MRGWKLAGVGLAVGTLVLTGCGGGDDRVTAEQVAEKCNKDSSYLTLGSDKKSIEYNFFAGTQAAEDVYNCLLKESGAPSSVDYKVKETRPIDGTQSVSWDGWEMNWNYGGSGKGTRILLEEK
ncbi:hypothetical protein [Tsukamurella pseudospumae]|uniref:Lipoprotein n=1 Tax=Tsukamurella pseudospumae TaxID=239498 RepID=A0A137YZD6_9ACTN|nr:hypothetical protein [Tsukamurella pseudospumae]KXO91300.1 hypothetical protein AXK61_07030 [Tsukamurella pseudospumae]